MMEIELIFRDWLGNSDFWEGLWLFEPPFSYTGRDHDDVVPKSDLPSGAI